MDHLNIILPIVLLGISFLLKLVVDRNIDGPAFINAICELPVDILFLSLSFSIAFTITDSANISKGLFYCFIGLAISILVVIIWRRTLHYFSLKRKRWIILLFLNLLISGLSLNSATELVMINQKLKVKSEIPQNSINFDNIK